MILDDLAAATRRRIARQKEQISPAAMRERAERAAARRAAAALRGVQGQAGDQFVQAARGQAGGRFAQALGAPGMSFICEVKRASPSKGLIAANFPYRQIARDYEAAGAAAISCLTETDYFRGSDAYLQDIAADVSIPVLRKDFTIDPYMVDQAAALGASAVLLICAILDDRQLEAYRLQAEALGLDALVEAHDEEEVRRAAASGAKIIGVNNRNLKDFTVDIRNAIRLRPLAPGDTLYVAESGIRTPADVAALREGGTDAVLIGETLMRSEDKRAMLDQLRGEAYSKLRSNIR